VRREERDGREKGVVVKQRGREGRGS